MTSLLAPFHPPQTRESLSNDVWRACDVLRRDNDCGGIMEYVEHLAWRSPSRSGRRERPTCGAMRNLSFCSRWRACAVRVASSAAGWPAGGGA